MLKGSRDPLGLVPIRTALGRQVISNLNSQSNSARGFTTLILGRYLAQFLLENGDTETEPVDIFLRFEQLCAYARYKNNRNVTDIRGIERVRANFQKPKRIPIQTDTEGRLLTDQKRYGLWGLFSVPARTSQLIDDQLVGVTESAAKFIETNYIPTLKPIMKPLTKWLKEGGYLNTDKSKEFEVLRSIFANGYTMQEQEFYNEYLCDAPNAQNRVKHQKLFNQLLRDCVEWDDSLGRKSFESLKAKALSLENNTLACCLDQILRIEAVLAILSAAFSHLLSCDHKRISSVSADLSNKWGQSLPNIEPEKNNDLLKKIDSVYPEQNDVREYFNQCQKSLADGKYSDLIEALVHWNKYISVRRGGSPWLVLGSEERLDVHYRGLDTILPSADELAFLWHNGYFVTSLHSITHQLTETRN